MKVTSMSFWKRLVVAILIFSIGAFIGRVSYPLVAFDLHTIGWEAISAIGTMFAAVVALYMGLRAYLQESRRHERADRERTERMYILAFLLDYELFMTEGRFDGYLQATEPAYLQGVMDANAIVTIVQNAHSAIGMPVMTRFIDLINIFPLDVAEKLAVPFSGWMQTRLNAPRDSLKQLPLPELHRLFAGSRQEAIAILHTLAGARLALRSCYRPGVIPLNLRSKPIPIA